ncbi:MAG: TonB-dependent receptor [Bacteroidales bacterium]|nr:TonB-dependent receptor [Bacteroidales bacterium]
MRTVRKHDDSTTCKIPRSLLWSVVLSVFLFSGLNLSIARADEGASAVTNLQQVTVSGKVTDANKQPLPGVNVVVKGTTTGTITGTDGSYSLRVPNSQAVLQFSFIGYLGQEIRVGNQGTINVILAEDTQALEEVVVIGYGTMKKSDLTGSVASVKPEEMMKRRPSTIEQGLQGMVSGVTIIKDSGAPGAGSSIRIRGTGSINNSNEPLWVVDGIQVGTSASWLNPNDIESIEVLKDASASAIYGSRASNGVILVTTKKGSKGSVRLNFDATIGIATQPFRLDMANAEQFATAANKVPIANPSLKANPIWANPSALNNIKWQDEMYQTGISQQYNLSASGDNENTQAMLSVGYNNNKGILRGSDFERITARANVNHTIKDFIRIGTNINLTTSTTNNTGSVANIAKNIPTMDTLDGSGNLLSVPIQYADGTWGHYPRESNGYNGKGTDNLVAAAETRENPANNARIFASAFAEIDLMKGLTYRTTVAMNYNHYNDYNYQIRQFRTGNSSGTDNLSFNQRFSKTLDIENYLTYTFSLDKHNFTVLAGHSASKSTGAYLNAADTNFPTEDIRILSMSINNNPTANGGLNTEDRRQSFFGRLTWAYDNRFSLTATVRRDGSSNFGYNNKYGTFPSLAASWRISEEAFMKDQNIFSNLKLRLGWGQTGNAGTTSGQYVNYLTSANTWYYFYQQRGMNTTSLQEKAAGLAQTVEIDTNLKWETNEMTNIGLDMGFLDNKLTATIDYFRRDTRDLLLNKQLRPSTGFTQIYTNSGHIRNSGLEFELGYQNHWGDWNLTVKGNGSFMKNEAIDVGADITWGGVSGDGDEWSGSKFVTVTRNGYPVASYYGYRADGIFQSAAEVAEANASALAASGGAQQYYQVASTQAGDRKYKDLDGNGFINTSDREMLGNGTPDFSFGLNVSLGYKNWDFNMYTYGVAGRDILSYVYQNMTNICSNDGSGYQNMLAEYTQNAWSSTNPSNKYPIISYVNANDNHRISDAFIFDGSFLRIQNIQIGYTLPTDLLKKVKMESARVFFSVENLATFSDYKYGDPEVSVASSATSTASALSNGVDAGNYPNPRTFTFGVSLGF